ncbi:MAG: hypothetical protein DIU69_13535 [Bacillota bacterium]|nr:MAG: hypothetical protein DIU69_13535 [Bacillota bacterium]
MRRWALGEPALEGMGPGKPHPGTGETGPPFAARRVRDLSVVELFPGLLLVVACDSDGGIGPKPADTVQVSGYVLGRFGARVPLMELIASGARPFLLVDTLSVEMDPTGREIVAGIRDELASAGLAGQVVLNGSTEENVPVRATGMGVTVLGLCASERFRPGGARPGDLAVCVGLPKSAPQDEVRLEDPAIMDLAAAVALGRLADVHDMLPVGSRGIAYEAGLMATLAGLRFEPVPDPGLDLARSGGPATCCLVAIEPAALRRVEAAAGKPCHVVGTFVPEKARAATVEASP